MSNIEQACLVQKGTLNVEVEDASTHVQTNSRMVVHEFNFDIRHSRFDAESFRASAVQCRASEVQLASLLEKIQQPNNPIVRNN